ncbi:DMT family transporter [Alphaproteobacteria bacterium]|nr:DMT family transporter [Alphaproteobacteria bacterium]
MKEHTSSVIIVIIAGLIWSFGAVVVKNMTDPQSYQLPYLIIRGLTVTMIVGSYLFFKDRKYFFINLLNIDKITIFGGILLTITFIGFIYSITNTTAAVTLLMLALMPFFASLIAYLFINERISKKNLVAMIIAFFGIVIMVLQSQLSGSTFGLITGFISSLGFAFGTEPSVLQWIASIVIISGAVLISISASSFKDSLGLNSKQIKSTVIMSFVSSICLAFGLIFSQEASNHLSTTETVIYIRFFSLLSVSVILIFYRIKPILTKKSIPILIFQGILETTGYFLLVSAYSFDKIGIAVIISSGFGLVTIVLARIILKEKIEKIQKIGIFLTFIGVACISI